LNQFIRIEFLLFRGVYFWQFGNRTEDQSNDKSLCQNSLQMTSHICKKYFFNCKFFLKNILDHKNRVQKISIYLFDQVC